MSYNPDGNSRIGSSPNKLLGSALAFAAMFFALCISAFAQTTVTGRVTSSIDGEPLPSVNVLEVGTLNGTTTDLDGTFSITVSDQNANLQFSFVGYLKQVVALNGRSEVNVVLEEDQALLDEVVVTALGLSREKKSLGYSVTEVSGENLTTAKDPNVVNSLAGKVAGVVITQSTAGPGSGSRVVIRGNSSLTGNNQPLYVVDGVPVDNSGFGSAAGSGTANYSRSDYGTGVSDINPDDIESMTVLKGPNAAALYGSRAANGVILVTTKKGTNRKGIGVSYTANVQFDNALLLPEYQNVYGQGSNGSTSSDLETLRDAGGSWGAKMDGSNMLDWTGETTPFSAQKDNVKDFFDTGVSNSQTIGLSGGNEKATFRFSYTNSGAESILPNSGIHRHNFNFRGFSQLNDNLSVDAKVTYFIQEAKNRAEQGTEGILAYVYNVPRNVNMNDLKNYQNDDLSVRTYANGSTGNPYFILNNNINKDTRNRFMGFAKVTYRFNPDLQLFARVGTDNTRQDINQVIKVGHWFYPTGRMNYSKYFVNETNADFLLAYDKLVTDKVHVSANFGGNMMYSSSESMGLSGRDFKIPTRTHIANAQNIIPFYNPLGKKRVNSLYGSASFSYNDFVYLDLTARNDWSSALDKDNNSYFYPSASLSFLLTELVDPDRSVFDFLKVRTSLAQVGNDTGRGIMNDGYTLAQDGYLDQITLNRVTTKPNPDLKPEETTSFEVGTEFKMFGNRLYGDIAYYDISSKNLIMAVEVPASTGYSREWQNVGEMSNKGFEMMIGGTPVQTRDFVWDVSFNFGKNKNELVEMTGDLDRYIFSTTNGGNVRVQATVGGEFGEIYGTTYQKTEDGKLILNANGIPMATAELVKLGNYQPDWTGGLTNAIKYKNFDLRFLIDIRYGGDVYSGTDAAMDAAGTSKRSLQYRTDDQMGVVLDGVINTGDADNPVYEQNTNEITAGQYWGAVSGIASEYVYSQTNVRLRELTISYRLPKDLLKNTPLSAASIGLVGRNLFFIYRDIDNFDPESSYSTSNYAQGMLFYNMPTTRSIGFNLNLKF